MTDRVSVFVCAGHTVMIGDPPIHSIGSPGTERQAMPGELIQLDAADAERLMNAGFVQSAPVSLAPPKPPNPSGIGLQSPRGVQGPTFERQS